MDFARRGERIPMHGFKVGVGTLVSLEIYRYIRSHDLDLPSKAGIDGIAAGLPEAEQVRAWLKGMGCPVRFSEMGVRKETMEEMLEKLSVDPQAAPSGEEDDEETPADSDSGTKEENRDVWGRG
jgi:glycerol dehydrogenase-like iron-containing ADH family enzyme